MSHLKKKNRKVISEWWNAFAAYTTHTHTPKTYTNFNFPSGFNRFDLGFPFSFFFGKLWHLHGWIGRHLIALTIFTFHPNDWFDWKTKIWRENNWYTFSIFLSSFSPLIRRHQTLKWWFKLFSRYGTFLISNETFN